MFRRSNLERELDEAKTRLGWQKKRTERIQKRYGTLDRQCVALGNEANGLRSRLYAAQHQAEAFKAAALPFFTRHRISRGFACTGSSPTRTPAAVLSFWTTLNC